MQACENIWPIEVGQRLRRKQLHSLVGGSHQWGITSCLNGSALLVFSNPAKARKFGYDRWEGPRSNGTYHYTGQGPIGDQHISARSNKALIRSKARHLPIHLFTSEGNEVTYIGLFELAEDPYRWERAPDLVGNDRRVVVFHLIRIEVDKS